MDFPLIHNSCSQACFYKVAFLGSNQWCTAPFPQIWNIGCFANTVLPSYCLSQLTANGNILPHFGIQNPVRCSKKSSMKCGIINLGPVSERFCNEQTVINLGCKMIRPRKRNSHRGTHCNFISLLSSTYNKCWNMLNVWSCAFNKFNKQISSDIPNTGIIRIFLKVSV